MTVVLPTYFLIGYNNAVFGSLLTLPAFVEQFPQTDTSVRASEGAYQHAQIQVRGCRRLWFALTYLLIRELWWPSTSLVA